MFKQEYPMAGLCPPNVRTNASEDLSITDLAYVTLRRELIACSLPPGSRLNIAALQGRFGLSQAAVREALSRLIAEGLVESERNRGFRAVPVSSEGLGDLIDAFTHVYLPCLRDAVEHADDERLAAITTATIEGEQVLARVLSGEATALHYWDTRGRFYDLVLGAACNPWLAQCCRMLLAQVMRYRHRHMDCARIEQLSLDDLRHFITALHARDAATVVRRARNYYRRSKRWLEPE